MTLKDKIHKLEHGLLDSKDDTAEQKAREDKERDAAAQAKLDALERNPNSGISEGHLSSVPAGADRPQPDHYNEQHIEPTLPPHHRAENTALRPESQENATGRGTAGDDLAI